MELSFNIFISHDNKDEAIAVELKAFLENIFLNSSVYVSSRDLQGGQTWIENIKLSLKNSQVIISIITRQSLNNNWIYFETGAGFVDDKSIPLITDGLKFGDLVPPLSLLQARTLTRQGIEDLVSDISAKLGMRTPKMLTGIERLIEESERFLTLRTKEQKAAKTALRTGLQKPQKPVAKATKVDNTDPELKARFDTTVSRALNLTRKKILTLKEKFEIPTEEVLNSYGFGELQDISQAYNVVYPTKAFMNLLMLQMDPLPSKEAAQWQKMNVIKRLDDSNADLDKFEKTF